MATIYGSARNRSILEFVIGTEEDDLIFPLGGWDIVDGKGGIDTVVVQGLADDFALISGDGVVYVDSLSSASMYSERVQLINVEKVQFSDRVIDLRDGFAFTDNPLGSDIFNGGPGIDTVSYSGPSSQYRVEKSGVFFFVEDTTRIGVQDRLGQIERVHFSDQGLAFDLNQNAGTAAKLVGALLGSDYVQSPAVMGIAIGLLDKGMSAADLVLTAVESDFFQQLAGGNSHEHLVRQVYRNIWGVDPDPDVAQEFIALLDKKFWSINEAVLLAASTEENLASINLSGLTNTGVYFDY